MKDIVKHKLKDVVIPDMVKVRQTFDCEYIRDIKEAVTEQLSKSHIIGTIKPDMRIAITCGSRGISNINIMIKQMVEIIRSKGAHPFMIPAMGSHGGATASGQEAVLEELGITEAFCGCPVLSSMEVVKIGETSEGHDVVIDKNAAEADGVIVVNRIKAHTGFVAPYESGLMKMMTIGMGKQAGAEICHQLGPSHMPKMIPLIGNVILEKANILFGLAILENAYKKPYKIQALTKSEIRKEEPGLLSEAKKLMPRLLFDNIDILIVDEIGKEISGNGMDPNVTGRFLSGCVVKNIHIKRIVVLGLSKKTKGNAVGIGAADFITKKVFNSINLNTTYPNAITSTAINTVSIPMMLNNDEEAIKAALKTCNVAREEKRVVRIKNTMRIDEIYISSCMLEEAQHNKKILVIGKKLKMLFDKSGFLV